MSAGLAFLHDHGGELHGVGGSAAHARTGRPLSGLADFTSRYNLPPLTHAVLHLVSAAAILTTNISLFVLIVFEFTMKV